ncbi:MAG: DUF805 domain-containing protein [Roseomonas sp.]|nr:DUF805 domain-containing protein [Roseomonas sp.]MCA3298432.1 DUF805 domain-containing protein [Roseomonas sp.]
MGFRTWFSLKGRISRLTWCIFYFLIPNGIIFAAGILDARVLPKNTMPAVLGKGISELSVVSALALLLGLWLSLAGQVKRWHDQDRTGWWGCLTVVPTFIIIWHLFYGGGAEWYIKLQFGFPLLLMLFLGFSSDDSNANQFVLASVVFVGMFILFLWVLFFVNGSLLPGTRGPNRFGPDPLAPKGVDKNTVTATFSESALRNNLAPMPSHQPDQKKSGGNRISLAQWFSHKGRISRKTWWIFYCLLPICLLIVLSAAQQMIKLDVETPHKSSIGEYAMLAVFYSLGLVILWIGFAGLTKRWHDQNKSGWWAGLLFVPILSYPLFLIFISLVDLNDFGGLDHRWIGAIFALTSLLPFITLFGACAVAGFQPGTPGPNRFGPDPLAAPPATNIALPPSPQ